jgi:4-carboxymuconolactone decarboxylase
MAKPERDQAEPTARLPYLTAATATSGQVAAELDQLPPLRILAMVANAEGAFGPWRQFASALLSASDLSAAVRELVILRVAALSPGADYEWEQHEPIALETGLSEAQIESARTGEGVDRDDQIVLDLVTEVVRDVSPSEETWARATGAFSPRETIEMLLIIGQYMMVARVAASVRIDPDPPAGSSLIEGLRIGGGDP